VSSPTSPNTSLLVSVNATVAIPLSNSVVCSLLFRSSGHAKYTCNSCSREYRSLHGVSNLMNHLRRFHVGFEAEAEAALRADNSLRLHIVDERTSDIYRKVEWGSC
jgi:hypothetical protein